MTRVAWETGVTQRERDAAAALRRPHAQKRDLQAARTQLDEATAATKSVGAQLATLDPHRSVRADVHFNAIIAYTNAIIPLVARVTPADIAEGIEVALLPGSAATIGDLTAPLPSPGAGGPAPAAPAPLPPRSGPSGAP